MRLPASPIRFCPGASPRTERALPRLAENLPAGWIARRIASGWLVASNSPMYRSRSCGTQPSRTGRTFCVVSTQNETVRLVRRLKKSTANQGWNHLNCHSFQASNLQARTPMNTSSFSLFHHPAVLPFIIHSKWRSHRLLGAAFVILSSLSLSAAQYPSYTVVDIGTFGGARSLAYDLNNLDEVVGEAWTTGDASTRAFLFSTNTLTDLGTLPGGTDAYAYGINDFSVIVGEIGRAHV